MKNKNNFQEEVIEVKNIHCKSCVKRIEAKLLQLGGVNKVRASLVDGKMYVMVDLLEALMMEGLQIQYKSEQIPNMENNSERTLVKYYSQYRAKE